MQLTSSYEQAFATELLDRYHWLEVRNAAAMVAASDPAAVADIISVLTEFNLSVSYLMTAGGAKSALAADLDQAFRRLGWRETHMSIETVTRLDKQPWRPGGETAVQTTTVPVTGDTHKLDNVQRRIAIDVEWHAKDGNLDRDISAFRALYDAGVIDAGILITRSYADVHYLAEWLGAELGWPHLDARGNERKRFSTTTTTTMENTYKRLVRGDAGGCPVLAIGIGYGTYRPGLEFVDPDGVVRSAPRVPPLGLVEYWDLVGEGLDDRGSDAQPGTS
ncbi:BglII/BstYI family type II restriction endonuclease [Microlunatus flavus]|uniref:Restriction endonuclease BglII n=1 Tax=Microlunatus flavus TaxID=1036181 RepID=A0A1H9C6Y1_9ACTN|nr:BglII/BstYI family type II restriction endonuclease [Microlunatus flavus]SEP97000.1 Restriction endonuclease BglII [Microlunatus flavus]